MANNETQRRMDERKRLYDEEMARRRALPSSGGTNSQGAPVNGSGAIPNQDLARQKVLDRAPKMLTARSMRENRPLYVGRRTSFNGQMLTDEQVKDVKPYKSANDMSNYTFGRDGVGGTSIRKPIPTPRTGKVIMGDGDSRDLTRQGSGHMRDLPPPPTIPAFEGTTTDKQTGMVQPRPTNAPPIDGALAGLDGQPIANTHTPIPPNPQNVQIPTYGQEHNALPEGYRGQPPQGQPQYAENEFADLGRTPQMPIGQTGYSDQSPTGENFVPPNQPNVPTQIALAGNEPDLTRQGGGIQPFTVPMGADNVTVNTEGYNTQMEAYEATISGENPPLESIEADASQPWDYDVQFDEAGSLRPPTGGVATPGGTTTTDVVRSPMRKARELERIGNDLASKPAVQTAIGAMKDLANPQGVMDEFGNEHIPSRIPPQTEEEFFDDRETGGASADQRRREQLGLEDVGGAMAAAAGTGGPTQPLPKWQQAALDKKLKEQRANARKTAAVDPVEPGDSRGNQRGSSSPKNPNVAGEGAPESTSSGSKGAKPKSVPTSKLGKAGKWLWRGGKWVTKKAPWVAAGVGAIESVVDNDDNQADQAEYIDRYGGLAPIISNSQAIPDVVSGAASGAANLFDVGGLVSDEGYIPDDVINVPGLARRTGSAIRNVFTTNDRSHLGFGPSDRANAFEAGADKYIEQITPEGATSRERQNIVEKAEYRAAKMQKALQADYDNGTENFSYDSLSDEDQALYTAMGGKTPGLENDAGDDKRRDASANRVLDERDDQIRDWQSLSPAEQVDKQLEYERKKELQQTPVDQGKPVSTNTGQFYKRVGEDGIVEFTTDQSEAQQGGYKPVDLPKGAQPSKIAAQDSIGQFPGNNFLKDINQDLKRRSRTARSQRRQATSHQQTIFDQAASAVNRMDIKGLTEGGRADMISEFAATLQQGRDAYKPNDINTTDAMIDADRNEIYAEGNEIDSDRNDIYGQRNLIDAFGGSEDRSLKRGGQTDDLVESILNGFTPDKVDSEGKTLDQSGYRDGTRNFIRSSGIRAYIDSNPNMSNQNKSRLVLDGAVGSQMVQWMQEGGVPIGDNMLSMGEDGSTPLQHMIAEIMSDDANKQLKLDGRDMYDMVMNPTQHFGFNKNQSDKVILRIGNKKVRLSEFLGLGQGAASSTAAGDLYQR
jgi:hypothetical protein